MVLMLVHQEPWFIVTYSANLITDVLGVLSSLPFGPGEEEHAWVLMFSPDFGVGIAVMVAYAIVGFVTGMAMGIRRED
jgi:hypothetical protein